MVYRAEAFRGHESVSFFHDEESGLKAIIAIHSTALGPAAGGCRMWPYVSEEEALTDVLRLSRGMTYKAAMAGLEQGGKPAGEAASRILERVNDIEAYAAAFRKR